MKKLKDPTLPGAKKPLNVKRILILVIGSLISSFAYFVLVKESELLMKITIYTYMIIASVAIVAYFIYNRGIVSGDITAEMLPDTMSPAEKQDYIDDCYERRRKSKCLLVVMFIFLVPLTIDLMKLFVVDTLFPGVFD